MFLQLLGEGKREIGNILNVLNILTLNYTESTKIGPYSVGKLLPSGEPADVAGVRGPRDVDPQAARVAVLQGRRRLRQHVEPDEELHRSMGQPQLHHQVRSNDFSKLLFISI